jgi:hypothetical protein
VYAYPSVEDAQRAHQAGGTGFLIEVPAERHPGLAVRYVVTNSHVAVNAGAVRVNTHDGGSDVMPVSSDQWFHHIKGDDVAVMPIPLSSAKFRYRTLPTSFFLTNEDMANLNVGPGDDVYFMGRFIAHDGTQNNQPVVRFGTIAMMPGEPVYQEERAFMQESFLIEARSLSGFSGSPVMLYIPPFSNRFSEGAFQADAKGLSSNTTTGLLGIDWGTMRLPDEALTHTGIMGVVPVWKLRELLDDGEVVAARQKLAAAHAGGRDSPTS